MWWILNACRRWTIRRMIGRMEVCANMTVIGDAVSYSGRHGGVICDNVRFVEPDSLADIERYRSAV